MAPCRSIFWVPILVILGVATVLGRTAGIGGHESSQLRAPKFLAYLRVPHPENSWFPPNVNQKYRYCAGVLVSMQHVLTAAHCVANNISKIYMEPHKYTVELGVPDSASYTGPIPAKSVVIHSGYIGRNGYYVHNLALITLSRPLETTNFHPLPLRDYVRITKDNQIPVPSSKLLAVNWGPSVKASGGIRLNRNRYPDGTFLKVISQADCGARTFQCDPRVYPDHKLCAESSTDVVHKIESGGPLISKMRSGKVILEGILSHTLENNCDGGNSVTVFSRISEYHAWIAASRSR